MKHTVVFKLSGALANAVAVEWTNAPAPEASGRGWEPCLRLGDGSWRMASYGGGEGHWRAPGPFSGIALRYRLEPAGPWSPISESRKEITIVAVAPEAPETPPRRPEAADWDAFAVRLPNGKWTGVVVTRASLGAVGAVDWLGLDPAAFPDEAGLEPHYEPTKPFDLERFTIPEGERWWLFQSKAATVHERDPGTSLSQIRFRYRIEGGTLSSRPVEARRTLNETRIVAPTPVPPVLVAAPVMTGVGTIGRELTVSPGTWGGDPAPALTFQWLRNGTAIAGATGTAYIPVAADDMCDLACRVVATNAAGTIQAVSAAVKARYAPPVAKVSEDIAENFDEGPGPQAFDTAWAFAGDNLAYGVTGAGAEVDRATGVVLIPTDVPMSERVTVTASNSGGSVSVVFVVTVEAADIVEEERPRRPVPADWRLFAVSLPNSKWTGVVATRASLGDVGAVDWVGLNPALFPDEAGLEPHYEPTKPFNLEGFTIPEGERWWLFQSKATIVHERDPGTSLHGLRFRYRLKGAVVSSTYPEAGLNLNESQIVRPAVPQPTSANGPWQVMPIRNEAEKAQGLFGGESMQFPHGAWRDAKDPRKIIWGQDMGAVWWTNTNEPFWNNSGNLGLFVYMMQAVGIHPTTGDWYAVGASDYEVSNRNFQGIYRKRAADVYDPAKPWELVRQFTRVGHWRWMHKTIAFASDGTVIVAVNRRQQWEWRDGHNGATVEEPGQIVRSPSGNAGSWTTLANLDVAAYGRFTGLYAHPSNASVLYLTTTRGILKSTNGGTSWAWLSGTGGLPGGRVFNIALNPANGNQFYVAVSAEGTGAGIGVYYTANGGGSFTAINVPSGSAVSKIYASPVDFGTASARLYLVRRNQGLVVSGNNGASWQAAGIASRPGVTGFDWTAHMQDAGSWWLTEVLPHPTNKNEAIGTGNTAWHKTTNGGANWVNASTGFSGRAASLGQCWDFHETDPNKWAMGIYDAGWQETRDGGQSFVGVGPVVPDPINGGNLHQSMHNIARLWNANEMVATLGLLDFCLTVRSTNPMNAGSYSIVDTGAGKRYFHFMRRHRTNENIIYHQHRRSTNRGQSWVPYGANAGEIHAMHKGNPDVIYGIRGSQANTVITRSTNQGASFSDLVAVGWALTPGDGRMPVLEVDPERTDALWTVSSNRDVARWSAQTGWKTNFNLLGYVNSLFPGGFPQGLGRSVNAITVDPRNRNRVYVLLAIPGASKVFVTENGWADSPTWADITGNLPVTPGGNIWVHPLTGEVFRATAGNGTYRMMR